MMSLQVRQLLRIPLYKQEITVVEHTSVNEEWSQRQPSQYEQLYPGLQVYRLSAFPGLTRSPKKIEPKIKNRPQSVCAKSIFTLIMTVSDKFIKKSRRSRFTL